jgi:integrase
VAHIQRQEVVEKRTGKKRVRWQARFRGPDGRERTRRFDRKGEAEAWLAAQQRAKSTGEWADPRAGRVKFADWTEQWTDLTVDLRPSTRKRQADLLRTHLLPVFGSTPLARIDHLAVRRWVADLNASDLAPNTVRKMYHLLARILHDATDARLIGINPARGVPLPEVHPQEMRFLSPAEVARLAETVPDRYRALTLVAAYGGLRFGELAGLRRHRVEVLPGRVRVEDTCIDVAGRLHWGPPKTKAGRRTVNLPRTVAQVLGEHIGRYSHPDPQGLVFTAPEGGPLRCANFRQTVWTPAVREAGLAPLRLHDLRHTAISLWIAAGAHPKEVSVRAGHSSVAFTLDRYGHLFPDADERLSSRLDALIGNQRQG